MLPLLLSESGRQVICVATASYAASGGHHWSMVRGRGHDKIVQLHQSQEEGEAEARSSLYPEWMAEWEETCFRYEP